MCDGTLGFGLNDRRSVCKSEKLRENERKIPTIQYSMMMHCAYYTVLVLYDVHHNLRCTSTPVRTVQYNTPLCTCVYRQPEGPPGGYTEDL